MSLPLPRSARAWIVWVPALAGLMAAATSRASPAQAQAARTVWDGVYTREQAASCHGLDLKGTTTGPPLAGTAFVTGWSGLNLFALYDLIRTTMPAENPSTLSEQASADLVAAILGANSFPPGEVELAPAIDPLKLIRIEPKK
jgi:hypothetical protein